MRFRWGGAGHRQVLPHGDRGSLERGIKKYIIVLFQAGCDDVAYAHGYILQEHPTRVAHYMRRVVEVPQRRANWWRRLRGTGPRARRQFR